MEKTRKRNPFLKNRKWIYRKREIIIKNITYPTDDKLYKKIIDECRSIAADEGVELRRSYTQTIKKLSTIQRFKKNKNGYAKSRKAGKKITLNPDCEC